MSNMEAASSLHVPTNLRVRAAKLPFYESPQAVYADESQTSSLTHRELSKFVLRVDPSQAHSHVEDRFLPIKRTVLSELLNDKELME